MSMDLSEMLAGSTEGRPDAEPPAAIEPAAAVAPGIRPHDPAPLDWRRAVDAAAARLEESWVRPDVTGYMLASGLADEFAATLCAYGMMADEVAHMRDHDHNHGISRDGETAPK